jgi:ArsR family transcriptional regulator
MAAIPQLEASPSEVMLVFCKATADAHRLDILRVLRDESFGVMELCKIFDLPQPGMSHHLKVLAGAGLVETRREGNSIFYRRSMIDQESPIGDLTHSFFTTVDRLPLDRSIEKGMARVHTDRARNARQFFERNADRLKENQNLIAQLEHYAGCITDLLNNEGVSRDLRVLEVGPGESELINLLADKFDRIVAVDNSKEMLSLAKATLARRFADKVEFILGEPSDLVDETFDLAIFNMVLHHLPSPARMFRTMGDLLAPEGRLLIIDLRPHDQDWTREICGDLWLGFEPSDLDEWAAEASLEKGQSAYLGLKNGFQVQVRLFNK